MGRRKIEIEKIETKHQRQICFTKRRKGLFKKAAGLASKGCQIAAIVFSDFGNLFTYGNTDVDEIARRYLVGLEPTDVGEGDGNQQDDGDEDTATATATDDKDDEDDEDDDDDDDDDKDGEASSEGDSEANFWWKRGPLNGENSTEVELEEFEAAMASLRDMARKREWELLGEEPLTLGFSFLDQRILK